MSWADWRSCPSSIAIPLLSCWLPNEFVSSSDVAETVALTCCRRVYSSAHDAFPEPEPGLALGRVLAHPAASINATTATTALTA
jgi:hypothetical protein